MGEHIGPHFVPIKVSNALQFTYHMVWQRINNYISWSPSYRSVK